MVRIGLGVMTGLLALAAPAHAAGDAAKGKIVFLRCGICHALEPGQNKLGPSLAGVYGRKAGTVAGFTYSPAMKASGIVWSEAKIDAYVKAPKTFLPGNKMIFPGLAADADRANLLAYLATTKAKTK